MKTKRESNVMVEVIDGDILSENVTKNVRKTNKDFPAEAGLKFRLNYGIVRTSKGTFFLDSEGVGSTEPLEKENGEIYFDRTDGMFAMPFCHIGVTGKNIGDLSIKEKVNLADFIRSFGSRLESNFHAWNKFLSE